MNALAPLAPKLARLIPRLASDHDGEVVATVRAIARTLGAAGRDFHDLAHAIGREPEEPTTWHELALWCRDHDAGRLKPHERKFIHDMTARLVCGGEPTEKQGTWLRALYAKLRKGSRE